MSLFSLDFIEGVEWKYMGQRDKENRTVIFSIWLQVHPMV